MVSWLNWPPSLGWSCSLVDFVRTQIEAYRNVRHEFFKIMNFY
jgi:hypothetical protein